MSAIFLSPVVARNLDSAQYPQPRGSQYEGPLTLGLVDQADQRIEDLFIACTVELQERAQFVFRDEFDIYDWTEDLRVCAAAELAIANA